MRYTYWNEGREMNYEKGRQIDESQINSNNNCMYNYLMNQVRTNVNVK